MAEHIDTDAERDDACHCRDAVSVPGPKLGVTYHFSDCRVDTITDLCDEVDRLRAVVDAHYATLVDERDGELHRLRDVRDAAQRVVDGDWPDECLDLWDALGMVIAALEATHD